MSDADKLKERAAATLARIAAQVEAHPPAEKLVARLQDRIAELEAENRELRARNGDTK